MNATHASSGATVRSADSSDVLTVAHVSADRGGRRVLHDVDFGIAPGEFTGLIGTNGAGKTTLLRVILGLTPTSAGQVLVDGRPPTRRRRGGSSGDSGSGIGYVPQQVPLDSDMPLRARDVVALGLDGHRVGISLRSRRRRELVDAMLDAVDATGYADARVGRLSGGQQQRVLIAHALISRPRLLLLDEPLANLDLTGQHDVVALLASITAEQRIAVLISAHDMNPLLPVMDRIVYLANGRSASGTTDAVVRAEVLSALYGHPVDVLRVRGRVLVVGGNHDLPPTRKTDADSGFGRPR